MEKRSCIKIAVVGAESTGKSWLCEALAKHFHTTWVPEYARDYFNHSDIYNYTREDLVAIAKRQLELERGALAGARRYLFCDTTLITLKIWAQLEFHATPAFIEDNLKNADYDHYFITSNEIPWYPDPLRQNKHSRDLLFNLNLAEVQRTGIPYSVISGTESERLKNALSVIDQL